MVIAPCENKNTKTPCSQHWRRVWPAWIIQWLIAHCLPNTLCSLLIQTVLHCRVPGGSVLCCLRCMLTALWICLSHWVLGWVNNKLNSGNCLTFVLSPQSRTQECLHVFVFALLWRRCAIMYIYMCVVCVGLALYLSWTDTHDSSLTDNTNYDCCSNPIIRWHWQCK